MARHAMRNGFVTVLLAWPLAAAAQPGAGPSPVAVALVVERPVSQTQTFIATVQPVKRAVIGSAVNGRVVGCPIEEGDRVESGQPLAQLLTDTIELELAAAKAELRLREERLRELENGSRVEEVEQSRARLASAEAMRDYQEARLKRLRVVFDESRAVTDDEMEEALAASAEARESYAELRAAYDMCVAGPRDEQVAQARAEVEMQRAVVERLSDQIQKHTIIARFPGYVVSKQTELGAWVNAGDPIAEVVELDRVDVVAQVTEQAVPYVVPGAPVTVEVSALPDRVFEGNVVTTVPQGDLRARTFPVKVRVENELTAAGPLIKPGMFARVVLPSGKERSATLAPKDAVVLGQGTPTVYVLRGAPGPVAPGKTGKAVPAPVELGVASGKMIAVTGSLAPGDAVVVQGNERLRPGQDIVVSRVIEIEAVPGASATEPAR